MSPIPAFDIDSLELLGAMINTLFSPEHNFPAKRKTGLITTHSNRMLESIHADKAHVMLDGEIVCSGNPQIVMNKIADSGFDSCMECARK